MKILSTAFYIFGYGAFLIISCEMNVKHRIAYYAMMIPFLCILAILIMAQLYIIWK